MCATIMTTESDSVKKKSFEIYIFPSFFDLSMQTFPPEIIGRAQPISVSSPSLFLFFREEAPSLFPRIRNDRG